MKKGQASGHVFVDERDWVVKGGGGYSKLITLMLIVKGSDKIMS
jgi:hypothetical protein